MIKAINNGTQLTIDDVEAAVKAVLSFLRNVSHCCTVTKYPLRLQQGFGFLCYRAILLCNKDTAWASLARESCNSSLPDEDTEGVKIRSTISRVFRRSTHIAISKGANPKASRDVTNHQEDLRDLRSRASD